MDLEYQGGTSLVTRAVKTFAKTVSGRRVLLGYSGGVDSHVLLYELARIAPAYHINVLAIHFNHQDSAKSNCWEEHCQKICNSLNVKMVSTRHLDSSRLDGGKENRLRIARYQWFETLMNDQDVLVTAHHLDDQVETILFRLFRGSGVRGISGIPALRSFGSGELRRPLLNIARDDIVAVARYYQLCWVEDESNSDESFDRNFIRHRVVPVVRSRWPGVLDTVGRSARHLHQTETLLTEIGQSDYFLKHLEASECKFKNFGKVNVSEIKNMSLERSANLLRYWVRRIGHEAPSSSQMLELLRQIRCADRQQQARLAWNRLEFRRYRKCLYLLPAQQAWASDIVPRMLMKLGAEVPETGVRLRIFKTVGRGVRAEDVDLSKIKIDGYRKNIKIKLAWNQKTRALSNLFQELGVPPWERWRIPVLSIDGVVIHVPTIGSTASFSAIGNEPSIQFLLEEI